MFNGLPHFHFRKRVKKKKVNAHPKNKLKKFMDKAIYFIAFFAPLMTIPQILKIWVEKNAAGISLISWGSYLIAATFWLTYGIIHKEKPIIVTYTLWIILHTLVITGTISYLYG